MHGQLSIVYTSQIIPGLGAFCYNSIKLLKIDFLRPARSKLETWRKDYNEFRPHSSLGNLTFKDYAIQIPEPLSTSL